MTQRIVLAAFALALAACAAAPRSARLDPAKLAELRPGVSTEADAVLLFGLPASESYMQDGRKIAGWIDVNQYPTVSFSLMFGAAGVLLPTPGAPEAGPKLDPSRLAELQPGISTEADAVRLFGHPTSERYGQGGQKVAVWIDINQHPSVSLALLFGPNGQLLSTRGGAPSKRP